MSSPDKPTVLERLNRLFIVNGPLRGGVGDSPPKNTCLLVPVATFGAGVATRVRGVGQ